MWITIRLLFSMQTFAIDISTIIETYFPLMMMRENHLYEIDNDMCTVWYDIPTSHFYFFDVFNMILLLNYCIFHSDKQRSITVKQDDSRMTVVLVYCFKWSLVVCLLILESMRNNESYELISRRDETWTPNVVCWRKTSVIDTFFDTFLFHWLMSSRCIHIWLIHSSTPRSHSIMD
jgi:hypothetical protein